MRYSILSRVYSDSRGLRGSINSKEFQHCYGKWKANSDKNVNTIFSLYVTVSQESSVQ